MIQLGGAEAAIQAVEVVGRVGIRRVSFRMQGEYSDAYRQAMQLGMQVRWTDLRMSLDGYPARVNGGMALSNWEI